MESPTDPQELDSDDDEIDYSVKPEFYDPDLDTKDELWVHKKRKGHSSDAVLNCPACFTTLCLDCQRHEIFFTQYRAMFVLNCKIKIDQILRSPSGGRRQQRQRKPNGNGGSNSGKTVGSLDKEAIFRPVCCSVCSTEVAVLDEEEVYHFFNVISSES